MYLSGLIETGDVMRRKIHTNKPKKVSRRYSLINEEGIKTRVCLKLFCATFSISHKVVETCMESIGSNGLFIGEDKKKYHKPSNHTSQEDLNIVKNHISSFPKVESHYCRRDSSKLYLSSDLNLATLYRLYKEQMYEKNMVAVSFYIYQKVFHSFEPRLGFFLPKKDQCFHCNAYYEAADNQSLEKDWTEHKKREKEAMEMKSADKQKAVIDGGNTFRSITFDLQAILSLPFAGDNQLYYKRKLNVYNFTIFDGHNKDGYCFVWDECKGKKGSSEIATCLLKYITQLPETVSHVSIFSDTCGGQNRNKNIMAAMLYAVNTIENIKIIDLKFMESGHSYLEADSMHATIERARRHKTIYNTREWALLFSCARIHPNPYKVITLNHNDFYDLEKLVNLMVHNTTVNIEKEKVNWLKIKWMRFDKSEPNIMQYKYGLQDTEFKRLDISKKKTAGRKKNWSSDCLLCVKYPDKLPISEDKKKDLNTLLELKIIPSDYKSFYDELPTAKRLHRPIESDDE